MVLLLFVGNIIKCIIHFVLMFCFLASSSLLLLLLLLLLLCVCVYVCVCVCKISLFAYLLWLLSSFIGFFVSLDFVFVSAFNTIQCISYGTRVFTFRARN